MNNPSTAFSRYIRGAHGLRCGFSAALGRCPALWLGLLCALLLTGCATTGLGGQEVVIRAKNQVAPALVHIRPVKEVFAQGRREEVPILGSGFIISPDGYVVTNEHVAGESSYVQCVLSDQREIEARVVGVDRYTDLAVLKLDVDRPLPYVRFDTLHDVEAGQMVLALGSPHGLARSVSLGIISVTDRYLEDLGLRSAPFNNWIQTDAAINPGNSGGPLVNLRGQVVGVNARTLLGADNVGFAIPADIANEVAKAIIADGRVIRSHIGIELQEMMAMTDDQQRNGVVIAYVDPLSPALEGGLRPGDILLSVNDAPTNARYVEQLPDVRKRIADLPVGAPAVFTIMRGEETMSFQIITEELSDVRGAEREFSEWAFTAQEVTPEVARRAQLPSRMGIMVSGAQPGGIAAGVGLGVGDIILQMDDEEIQHLAQFHSLYQERVESSQNLVLLQVKRGALTRYVMVRQDAQIETPVALDVEEEGVLDDVIE